MRGGKDDHPPWPGRSVEGYHLIMPDVGRIMILVGLGIAALGVLILIGLPLFRLPGDIVIKGEHAVLIIPIATCIVLSIVFTVALSLLARR
jgi:hypothetical protein